MTARAVDAVVVGSGPNGLAAAITLARAGRTVTVLESQPEPGGGLRSASLTLPGFVHDVCSAIHPFGAASPFLSTVDVEWVQPEVALAHPLDGGRAAVLMNSTDETAVALGEDGAAFRRWIGAHTDNWDRLVPSLLGPLVRPPRHPFAMARFGLPSLLPARTFARRVFDTDEARGMFAGCAAHAFLPLTAPLTASFGVVLAAAAGAVGWPMVRGGSGRLADALVAELESLGGTLECDRPVRAMTDLPAHRAVLFDIAPRQVASIASPLLPARYRGKLERFRPGPAVFKVDYALSEPVPWTADVCHRAGTLHLGGTLDEIVASERAVADGRVSERPFVLIAQQSGADPTRAPAGKHTLWAYCHVPNGCDVDMTDAIDAQIERFAPGFRDVVLARHTAGPRWYEDHNAAYLGGDISGGAHDGLQLFLRPTARRPYRTPCPRLFLCSASTPPGGGVHGMCGVHAANAALKSALR